MTPARSFNYAASALYSDMTALICIYAMLTAFSFDHMMAFNFPVYFLCAAAALLVNSLFLRRERTVPAVAAINASASLLTLTVMFLLPHEITGILPCLFASLLFAYPAPRGLFLLLSAVSETRMLVYCEMSVMGAGLFFLAQIGAFNPGVLINLLCVLALFVNFAALSVSRTEGSVTGGIRRSLTVTAILSVTALAGGCLSMLLPNIRVYAVTALQAAKNAILAFFLLVERVFVLLASLIPDGKLYEAEPALLPEALVTGEAEELISLPVYFTAGLAGLFIAILAGLLLLLLYKMRKARFRKLENNITISLEKRSSPSLWSVLKTAVIKILCKLKFYRLVMMNFNTCAGVFVRLEYRGRLCGIPRGRSHTPREYLTALSKAAPESDHEACEAFLFLAEKIDELCFSPDADRRAKATRSQIRAMLRAIKPRGKQRFGLRLYIDSALARRSNVGQVADQ